MRLTLQRPSHPALNVRDDREAPLLVKHGTAQSIVLICPTRQCRADVAEWHDGQFADGCHARYGHRRCANECGASMESLAADDAVAGLLVMVDPSNCDVQPWCHCEHSEAIRSP
jgi:hypothetical protein